MKSTLRKAVAAPIHWLRQAPLIGFALNWLGDASRTALFVARASRRNRRKKELALCATTREVLSFATDEFGSNQNWTEIIGLIERLRSEAPRLVCEIGVADGGTNFAFSQALPDVELMIGIDLFVKGRYRLRHFGRPGQRLCYLDGSSHTEAMVSRVRSVLAGRKLDFLFIDGDHSFAGVRKDFLNYRAFVREGGTIAFHDICPDYLTRYGRETGNLAGQVPVFWQDLKNLYPHEEFVQSRDQDAFGIGAIRFSSAVAIPERILVA